MRITPYEQALLFAKLLKKYYPKGTTIDTLYQDNRQPYKSHATIQKVMDELVDMGWVKRISLSITGNKGPCIYLVDKNLTLPKKKCPECGQDLPDDDI